MAIEKLEEEQCSQAAKENQPSTPKMVCVTLRHMAAVISEAYTADPSIRTLGDTLPLHQQLVTATLLRLQGGRTHGEIDMKKLYTTYVKLCQGRKLRHEQDGNFRDMVKMMEGRGVVSLKKGKGLLQSKVMLKLSKEELGHILKEEFVTSIFI